MFKKLKRKFILTASLSSMAVLIIAFSAVYFVVSSDINRRPPIPTNETTITQQEPQTKQTQPRNEEFAERIKDDRKKSLETLLISLIITGATVEIFVILISFFLAEQSIKPVREAYENQKTFIANASHEIKTPLAVIQANLEAADIKGNRWLDNVAKKTEDLAALNNQLLTLAKMDGAPETATKEDVDLKTLTEEVANCYKPKLTKKKAALKITGQGAAKLNRADLTQLLNILVDNAVKYCDKKTEITIKENEIVVKNDGATIKSDELKHVFDRFYQTDKTKSGVGLGLSIAKQISEKNNWKLEVASTSKTTTFTLK